MSRRTRILRRPETIDQFLHGGPGQRLFPSLRGRSPDLAALFLFQCGVYLGYIPGIYRVYTIFSCRRNVMRSVTVIVNDRMQRGYCYERVAPVGRGFDSSFTPDLTPPQMLALGVFGGKYMTDCQNEFPASWWRRARLCPERHDPTCNWFGVNASQPLSVWRAKGWTHPDDPRGWFQWYCRYYIGRRLPGEDARQIARWRAIRRHVAQLRVHCQTGDTSCRRRQRQALLHWAYDSRAI